jgi:hypothetical protein
MVSPQVTNENAYYLVQLGIDIERIRQSIRKEDCKNALALFEGGEIKYELNGEERIAINNIPLTGDFEMLKARNIISDEAFDAALENIRSAIDKCFEGRSEAGDMQIMDTAYHILRPYEDYINPWET